MENRFFAAVKFTAMVMLSFLVAELPFAHWVVAVVAMILLDTASYLRGRIDGRATSHRR
ncbi:hypothetical protein [Burkholderia anthina]|uniref:hypothetical protein n=1 Tax=Burkholderia anthina TaxID=179879 RepID=UPI001AA05407|nr:hypothetical protein [Burkholderia anthina]QTD88755.1 hypothetical protein J4G50_13090 [Burkholderia anthina]